MQNRRYLLFLVMSMSSLLFSYEAYAKKGGGGWRNRTDTTPSQFSFVDQSDVALNSLINSNTITITGINSSTPISISNGSEYSLNGGISFTAGASSLLNNQTVIVRTQSSVNYLSSTSASLTVGGVTDTFTLTTLSDPTDTTPNSFSFTEQTGVALNSTITANTITVSGINAATALSVTGGEYAVNGGAFGTASSNVNNNDTVKLRVNSSSSYLTDSSASLSIGGVSDTFTVTTLSEPADTTPDSFSYTDQVDVALSTDITSNAITVSGINSAANISIVGGEYAVNSGAFVTAAGSVNNSDAVEVRVTASGNYATLTNATLTIGGVSDTFSVLTENSAVIEPGAKGNPSFTSEHFSGSANCQMCHDGLTDNTGKDVSIVKAWKSTMMANATRDPLWKAKVRTELNRTPALKDVINSKCSKCHAPMAHFEATKDNAPIEILGTTGFTSPDNAYHDRAMDGVSCTLCHQISDSPLLGTPEGMSGHYPIDSYANAVDRKIYGPYNNIFANPMRNNANYTPEYSAHVKESELCATCHNLKTPYTDENGNILSDPLNDKPEFPEQMPYSEWLASDYGDPGSANNKSCQQCHMARSNGVVMASRPMWLDTQRDDFAQHIFVGGNKFMLDMLDNNKEELGVLATDFSKIIAGTENLLANAANIEVLASTQTTDALEFSLRINSNTGHKLPSAYPSRRVILHVTVKDSYGVTVFESGKVNADGRVDGLASDNDQTKFEPHYELIKTADQVQVYEAIMQDYKGDVTYTLLRAKTYKKDNRLLPTGFDETKLGVPDDVKVLGDAAADANFIGGSDDISYSLAGLTDDNYTVTVEMIYQTLAYGFAQDLFKDTSKEVTDFKRMYNASNAKTTTITSESFVVAP